MSQEVITTFSKSFSEYKIKERISNMPIPVLSTLLIMIAIIIIGIVVFLIYYSVYKRNINKALEGKTSAAHNPMIPVESIGKVIVIIGIIVFAINIMSQLSAISADISNTNNNLDNYINGLHNRINQLEEALEEMQIEAANPLSSLECEVLDKVDTQKHTVDVYISCTPKEYTKNTEISIKIGNNVIKLKNTNGLFTGTGAISLFECLPDKAIVNITENGVTKTSEATGAPSYYLYYKVLPLISDVSLETAMENTTFMYDGTIDASFMEDFSDVKVTYYINDNVTETQSVVSDNLSISGKQTLNQNESFKAVIEGKDKYGYIHKSVLFEIHCDGTGLSEYVYLNIDNDNIFDGNGNLLYGNSAY